MAAFNTTVASFNVGYADFFTEHMKKLCNPVAVPEMPVEPLACANLPRSFTDSCINYSFLEEGNNIEGTNNFVLKNGMLDLTVGVPSVTVVRSVGQNISATVSPLPARLSCEPSTQSLATTSAPASVTWPSTSSTACCSWAWCRAWARSSPSQITRRTRRLGPKTLQHRASEVEHKVAGPCQEQEQVEEVMEAVEGEVEAEEVVAKEEGEAAEGAGREARTM